MITLSTISAIKFLLCKGLFQKLYQSQISREHTLNPSVLPHPKKILQLKAHHQTLLCALHNKNTAAFFSKRRSYIFILSVMRRLVKKIVLTFQGLGGNMKFKQSATSYRRTSHTKKIVEEDRFLQHSFAPESRRSIDTAESARGKGAKNHHLGERVTALERS